MRALCTVANVMNGWKTILAIAGLCLVAVGAFFIVRSSIPLQEILVGGDLCHTPTTILDPPSGVNAIGAAILLHGLGANRRTMMYLGSDLAEHGIRSYLIDLPGHGDSTDAFTFLNAEECAAATLEFLIREGQIEAKKSVLVGHSMGGAIAIRMADRNPVAATIAISPAPMILPRRMPANLLVLSGQYDMWPMRRQAEALAVAAGRARTDASDFAERRAFRLQVVPHATHTSLIVERAVAQLTEQWAMESLLPNADAKTPPLNLNLATHDRFNRGGQRLAGAVLGLLGLVLLFPLCPALVGVLTGPPHPESHIVRPAHALVVAEQAVCALFSVLLLTVVLPLRFLRLYNGDYLASLLLISGVLLLLMNRKCVKPAFSRSAKALTATGVLGLAAMLAMGAWFNWQLGDLWMNAPRWLRFAELLPAAWIFCFAEEVVLGPVTMGKRRAVRFAISLVLRLELWLACVLGYYMLANGQALLGVLVTGLAVFSILQRAATDELRRQTGSATAAAAFGAILAAWFIAAVFPLT